LARVVHRSPDQPCITSARPRHRRPPAPFRPSMARAAEGLRGQPLRIQTASRFATSG
jgi:hypothetical protein